MLDLDKVSYWEQKTFQKEIDFLIVGAGIVGYSTALHLRKLHPHAKILIIERGLLPSGASSKNAGFACFGSATELYSDLQSMPEEEVWSTVALRWKGLQALRSLIGDENLDLQINGSWDLITENEVDLFEKTHQKLSYFNERIEKITGEKEVYSIDSNVSAKFGFEGVTTSIYNRLEGQIDTSLMNSAFHKKSVNAGILHLFGVEAKEIASVNNGVQVNTSMGSFHAKKVAICTNGFAAQFIDDEEIHPARAQVLITHPIDNLPFEGTFHYQEGYYYFRNIDGRVLFGGGRNLDFKGETTTTLETTQPILDQLIALLDRVILPNTDYCVDHSWAGVMGVGESKKPIIKQCAPNVYCGVRLGGMGVAIGTLVGKELSEMI